MAYRTRSDVTIGARTWWGQHWLDLVKPSFPTRTSRFERGDVDARTGQLSGLTVLPGRLAGRAQGDQATAHAPEIDVPVLADDVWQRVIAELASTVRPALDILHARMPDDIRDRFAAIGSSAYPDPDALESRCTCGATGGPCRHVAALHHVYARAMDDDPLLLFALRGRSPERFRAELRAARAGSAEVVMVPDVQTVQAHDLATTGFDEARGDPSDVRVHPQLAEEPAALMIRLGLPPRIEDPDPLERALAAAAETAWKLAAGEGTDAADDELLLAELRAAKMTTAGVLADALGWEPERTLDVLGKLFEAGTVMRMGKGLDARYRAG